MEVMEKEFIVYRKDPTGMWTNYERKEQDKKELKEYISRYQNELEKIEVYKIKDKINVSIDMSISLNKEDEEVQTI